MTKDQITIGKWLRRHGVSSRYRRIVGASWTHIRNAADALYATVRTRHRFFTCLAIGVIAALLLAHCPLVGNLLATLGLSIAVVTGLVEELRFALTK
jgi:hypothetical protein